MKKNEKNHGNNYQKLPKMNNSTRRAQAPTSELAIVKIMSNNDE
jgi:hypothetical protein